MSWTLKNSLDVIGLNLQEIKSGNILPSVVLAEALKKKLETDSSNVENWMSLQKKLHDPETRYLLDARLLALIISDERILNQQLNKIWKNYEAAVKTQHAYVQYQQQQYKKNIENIDQDLSGLKKIISNFKGDSSPGIRRN